jgi:DNA-binding PadR family transcriptional regulator
MALQEALAALLVAGPSHGYQLMTTLESELGPVWETRASRVYLTLARMEQDGLVTATRVRQQSRPDRRLLRLTPRGRSMAERWLQGEGSTEDAVARLAVARVVVPNAFDRLAAALAANRSARLQRLRELRQQAREGFQLEALDADIARTQADLRWLSTVRDRADEIIARPRAHRTRGSTASESAS